MRFRASNSVHKTRRQQRTTSESSKIRKCRLARNIETEEIELYTQRATPEFLREFKLAIPEMDRRWTVHKLCTTIRSEWEEVLIELCKKHFTVVTNELDIVVDAAKPRDFEIITLRQALMDFIGDEIDAVLFRAAVKRWHPDRNSDSSATEKLKEINEIANRLLELQRSGSRS